MTAGVQNIDQAVHLSPPPSASRSDAKGISTPGKQTSDAPGKFQDFQIELALLGGGPQETESGGGPAPRAYSLTGSAKLGSAKPGAAKSGSVKSGSVKFGKKRDTRADEANLAAPTPVQVAEPQKQILPLAPVLTKLDENAMTGDKAKLDESAELSTQANELFDEPAAAERAAPAVQDRHAAQAPAAAKTTALPQLAERRAPIQTLPANAAPAITPDLSQVKILPAAAEIPVQAEVSAQNDQPKTSANPAGSSNSQPVLKAELKLPEAAPPEPVVAAIQETTDSASSGSPALAFAARMTAAPQKVDPAVRETPSQPASVSGASTPARIPVRYAATAQILQDAEEHGKDIVTAIDRSARTDARTDMVAPRFEISSPPTPSSGPAAPQQAAPTAHTETILEPPAAPQQAGSGHDIRVQVPDNNGGSTQVRFVASGGDVRVSVRTADEGLAQNLRGHLNDLSQRLSDGGIPAEIWKPGSSAASSQNNQPQSDREGRGSGGQQSGGQGGQQDPQDKRPAWLEEMETSLYGPQE